jgi:hypothetical protein
MEVEGKGYPVASSPLSVGGAGVEARIEADPRPRVLVFLGGSGKDAEGRARRAAFVQASLSGTRAAVRITANPVEFATLFRSGLWNTFVFMTDAPIVVPILGDELREAVFRGEGLVYVPWKVAGAAREIEPALGLEVEGQIPGDTHSLSILDGPLGPAQTLTLQSAAARLKLAGATLGGTIGQDPVLAANSFGHGRDVTLGFDPAVRPEDPARAALEGLFARAVLYAAPRAARHTTAGTVVPLLVGLDNPGAGAQSVEVALALPAGIRVASIEDAPVSSDPPVWQVELPAGGEHALRIQIVLPDQPGGYLVETTVKVNGQALPDPPGLLLEVPRSTEDGLADIIAELESWSVAPRDHGHLRSAIALLRIARSLGGGLAGLEARIRLAAEAAARLGRIESIDVDELRSEITRLIGAWERASFERATSDSPPSTGASATWLAPHQSSFGSPPAT